MRNMFLKDNDLLWKVNGVAYDIVNDWMDMDCPCDIMEFMKDRYIPLLTLDVECVANIKQNEKEGWLNSGKSREEN